jgi:hypothetical protein
VPIRWVEQLSVFAVARSLTPDSCMAAGERNGRWSVDLPAEEVPPELPEPCLGVNFARDGMARKDWLALVAVHSDAWLMAVAFFYAVKLDSNGRYVLPGACTSSGGRLEGVVASSRWQFKQPLPSTIHHAAHAAPNPTMPPGEQCRCTCRGCKAVRVVSHAL